jgi:hypothetical protein
VFSAVAEGRIVRRARRRNVQDIAEIVEMRENIFDVNGSPALGPNVIEILRRDIDSLGIKAGPINVSGQPTANKLVRGHDLLTRGGRIYTAWTEQDTQTGSVKLRLGGIGQDGGVLSPTTILGPGGDDSALAGLGWMNDQVLVTSGETFDDGGGMRFRIRNSFLDPAGLGTQSTVSFPTSTDLPLQDLRTDLSDGWGIAQSVSGGFSQGIQVKAHVFGPGGQLEASIPLVDEMNVFVNEPTAITASGASAGVSYVPIWDTSQATRRVRISGFRRGRGDLSFSYNWMPDGYFQRHPVATTVTLAEGKSVVLGGLITAGPETNNQDVAILQAFNRNGGQISAPSVLGPATGKTFLGVGAEAVNGAQRLDVFTTGNFQEDLEYGGLQISVPSLITSARGQALLAEPILTPVGLRLDLSPRGAGDSAEVVTRSGPEGPDFRLRLDLDQGVTYGQDLTSAIGDLPGTQELALVFSFDHKLADGQDQTHIEAELEWTLRGEKVPLLGQVPLIGNLFRGPAGDQWQRAELIYILTPTIVEGGQEDLAPSPAMAAVNDLLAGQALESRFEIHFGAAEPVSILVDNLYVGIDRVPEPSVLLVMGLGVGLLLGRTRRKTPA